MRRKVLRFPAVLALAVAMVTAVGGVTPAVAASSSFEDVPRNQLFYGDITWLVQNQVTQGYPDGTFRPTAVVSRDAMAAFLYAFAEPGSTAPACTTKPFPDVATDNVFCPQITWAAQHHVTKGYADRGYHPAAVVNRAQMAAFLYALRHDGAAAPACTTSPFPADVARSNIFCGAIAWLARNDIADGVGATHFQPAAPVLREAMAAFLHRLAAPAPATSNAHYLRTTDVSTMTAAGRADAAADKSVTGTPLHLIDVGAQSTHDPLSTSHPGVVLSTTEIRIDYAQLVGLIRAYVNGYTAAGGADVTVAVGTNSDGDWSAYPATVRADDWWNSVIAPLRSTTPASVDVIAADDMEAGFAGTEAQVAAWKSAFLSAASSVSGTALVFNGSADACPTTVGATGRTCVLNSSVPSKNWTEGQLGALAGGAHTLALPQIYYPAQAIQWANIATTSGVQMTFAGALTERGASPGTFSAERGWIALWNSLTAAGRTPSLPVVADLDVLD